MTTEHSSFDERHGERDDLDDAPENLPGKAWVTLVLFAAFVIGTSGCMIGIFLS